MADRLNDALPDNRRTGLLIAILVVAAVLVVWLAFFAARLEE